MAKSSSKSVKTIKHEDAKRRNIPTVEFQSVLDKEQATPIRVAYERRNQDLDPQLVWRGKDMQDWSDLVVHAPPLYIQEKIHPKALIDDLMRQSEQSQADASPQIALFADFNGLPDEEAKTEFYQHDQNWSNRMILGDSLQVMASLAEREGLRGQVQCIYFDPPYGIKFNSNFQWSTTSRDVKDGNTAHITREPEQVKAFRDTWRDGIHSYLTYLRDRLTVARDLLTESGSIFVQIGDENVHRVRAVMDEIFGDVNYVATIQFSTTSGFTTRLLSREGDFILWFSRSIEKTKFRQLFRERIAFQEDNNFRFVEGTDGLVRMLTDVERSNPSSLQPGVKVFRYGDTSSQGASFSDEAHFFCGKDFYPPPSRHWTPGNSGITRWHLAGRLSASGNTLVVKRYAEDHSLAKIKNLWNDTVKSGFGETKTYVVQTLSDVVQRCLLMATDPGDLVLDPTCGSGTTAYVAEQWGRRWITIDTSRVALALARARLMGARYPYYLLADSREGQLKEAEVTRSVPSSQPAHGNIRHGFVYERVPHITLKSIANNAEIDVIWEKWQETLEPLRARLNAARGQRWEEWEIPRQAEDPWSPVAARLFGQMQAERTLGDDANTRKLATWLQELNHHLQRSYTLADLPARAADPWPQADTALHAEWWAARIARQQEIDASIAAKADVEYLYDKPYENKKIVRVAGPFTVESVSPHRMVGVDENNDLIDPQQSASTYGEGQDFVQMILEALRVSGVQQVHKQGHIRFSSLTAWPGALICAEGRYLEDEETGMEKRAAIFIGPEFGTVTRADLVEAGREALEAQFDIMIACAFSFEAHTTEFNKLLTLPVLKARMNADLHMADALKNTGSGNLFVIFGEPDIEFEKKGDQARIHIRGVDVFNPSTGTVESDDEDGIACWFIDTDYNGESFFVRHAYFLGANDPYGALRTTLKAEIHEDAWASLHSAISRPFSKPNSGRIAVKVINHLGDEVMKVLRWPGDGVKPR